VSTKPSIGGRLRQINPSGLAAPTGRCCALYTEGNVGISTSHQLKARASLATVSKDDRTAWICIGENRKAARSYFRNMTCGHGLGLLSDRISWARGCRLDSTLSKTPEAAEAEVPALIPTVSVSVPALYISLTG
jgi:hypothetical protein